MGRKEREENGMTGSGKVGLKKGKIGQGEEGRSGKVSKEKDVEIGKVRI